MAELSWLIEPVYIVTIFFFIIGMQRMSHPLTARSGIVWAGAAMLIATLATFFTPNLTNLALIAIAIVIGGGFGYIAAKRVAMTDMPQMIALYNGMGGGAAAGISAVALLGTTTAITGSLAVIGGLIGAVSFTGSIIAFMKLQGWMRPRPITFPGQHIINIAGPGPRHRLWYARYHAAVMDPDLCCHLSPAVLHSFARVRVTDDTPDRRG